MPGDVVRRMIKGKDTQRGYCRDIELTACVQVLGSKQVLTNVKSEDLVPLEVIIIIIIVINIIIIIIIIICCNAACATGLSKMPLSFFGAGICS